MEKASSPHIAHLTSPHLLMTTSSSSRLFKGVLANAHFELLRGIHTGFCTCCSYCHNAAFLEGSLNINELGHLFLLHSLL